MRRWREMKKGGKIDDCHLIAHIIGDETMRKHSFDTGRALASCSLDCIQGCVHGAMQTFVSEKIDTTDIAAELKHVCDSVADNRLLRRQCIHGVGHGFLTGSFLPLEEAIDACHHFQGREALTCLDGVSMEIMQAHLLVSEEELKAELPNICAEAIAVGKDQFDIKCFISIGEGLMFFTGHDLEKSTRLCRLLPAERQPACVMGVVGEAEDAARSNQ